MSEKSMGDLAGKIVFLTITARKFGNLRTSHVGLQTTALETRFDTKKRLLDSPELKEIAKRDGEIKMQIKDFLLPYKVGVSILPRASAKAVREILDAYKKVERPALVTAFIKAAPDQKTTAQADLKEQFDDSEYLVGEELADEFEWDYDMWTLTMDDDMKDLAHEKIMEAAAGIADALATGAHMLVSRLADSLSTNSDGKPKKLYDAHFTKLQEFLAGFDIRNVTDAVELKEEMDKLKFIMSGMDVEKVRNNEGLRVELASKLSEATSHLTTMVQQKGRKFRDVKPIPVESSPMPQGAATTADGGSFLDTPIKLPEDVKPGPYPGTVVANTVEVKFVDGSTAALEPNKLVIDKTF
jgi:hypothetical protein